MATFELKSLVKSYGKTNVIHGIDLFIPDGEFVVFVGPSGCGKSTTLRMIAGLEDVPGGEILIDGRVVNEVDPKQRNLAMVFQNYAIYPHMTVRQNIAFGLYTSTLSKAEKEQKVEEAGKTLGLTDLLDRRPSALSGGQRQRVAIGRAIVRAPEIFLFDEPLSNLDAALRADMRIELTRLHKQLGATMIYVTHDQIEAMTMADRIVVLNAGYIAQVGAPLELYSKPQNVFVAGFIGNPRMNFLPARCIAATETAIDVECQGQRLTLPVKGRAGLEGADMLLGIRPEHITLGGGDVTMKITPTVVEQLGQQTIGYATIPASDESFLFVLPGTRAIEDDQEIVVGFSARECHLFDANGEAFERLINLSDLS